jgi:hypothetical protein
MSKWLPNITLCGAAVRVGERKKEEEVWNL